jgi:hypothetical protein
VLYIGAEALDPKGTDQVISTMAAAQLLVTSFNSASSQAFTHLYFLTAYTVPVVMGFALWRSRTVPRWLAVLLTAGLGIAEGHPRDRRHLVHASLRGRDGPAGGTHLAGSSTCP